MPLLLAGLAFLIVALVVLGAVVLLGERKGNIVRARLEALEKGVSVSKPGAPSNLIRSDVLSDVPVLNHLLKRWPWSARLRDFVGQAGMEVKPGKLLLLSAVLGSVAYVVANYFYRNPAIPPVAVLVGTITPMAVVFVKRSRRLQAFERQFPEAVDLLGRSLRAGYSFTSALELISTELPQPVSAEFRTTFDEQNFGLPLKDALVNLSARVPLIDVRFFVTALMIHKETGGNLAEILDNLSHVIRERFRIVGEVRIKTAQGRMTAAILMALPPGMLLLLRWLNPTYVNLLFSDPWGTYMLGGAGLMQVVGSMILWKIVNIEV